MKFNATPTNPLPRLRILLLMLVSLLGLSSVLRAQSTYPVQVNVYLSPPHGTYLSDYYTGTREKMVVSLLNRDMQRPSLEVFLRVTVSSASGFQVRSRLEGSYPPVTLDAGVPVRLTQDDLAPYFLPRNTTASGGSPGGQLPEGLVEFTVEAFERYTGKALSLGATARVWLSRQKPPLPRLPSNGDNLPFREPMQLKFQWEPRHRNLSQVEYEFELRELPGNGVAPQSAFAYAPVVHGERLACTYLAYNTATMYPLSPGKTYGWRVRAVAKDGVDEVNAFDNGGYSQTWWFSTSTACDPPEGLRASLEDRSLELSWTAPADTGRYLVQLREKDAPSSEWQSATTPGTHYTARGLNRGSAYEYRVGRVCAVGGPVFTGVGEVAVPEVDSARMVHCGVPGKYDRSNREPLRELRVGDVVIAGGDYPMTVTKVTASLGNGMFAGEGWIQMKWLFDSKLAVEFSDLVINADKIQIGGVARAKQRKDESGITNLGGGKPGADGSGVKFTGKEIGFVVPDNPAGGYDPESGQVVVYSTDGQEAGRFDVPKNEKGEAVFPVKVKDKDGKVYEVRKEEGGESAESSAGKPQKLTVELSEAVTSLGSKDSKVSFRVNNTVYGDGGKHTMLASAKIPDIQVITRDSVKADSYTYTFDGKKKIDVALSQKDSTSYLRLSDHAENLKDGSVITVTKDNKKVAELKIETYDVPVVKFDMGNNYTGSYFFDKGFDEQAALKNPSYYDTIHVGRKKEVYYVPVLGVAVNKEIAIKVDVSDFDSRIKNDPDFRVVIKAGKNGMITVNDQNDSIVLDQTGLNQLKSAGLRIQSLSAINRYALESIPINVMIQSTREKIGRLEYYSADMVNKTITLIYVKFKKESDHPTYITPFNLQTYLNTKSLNQMFIKTTVDSVRVNINVEKSFFGTTSTSEVVMKTLKDSIIVISGDLLRDGSLVKNRNRVIIDNNSAHDYYFITNLNISTASGGKLGGAHYPNNKLGFSVTNFSSIGETNEELITHELGHWLNLPHTFEGNANIPIINATNPIITGGNGGTKNAGDNFMDYNLNRKRWFKIQLINITR